MFIRIFRAWLKWRNNWDDLCNRCGKCCYIRTLDKDGRVRILYSEPCMYLDTKTHMCTIFPDRFKICKFCGKVNLRVALFHPTLPEDCAYRKTFRLWDKKK